MASETLINIYKTMRELKAYAVVETNSSAFWVITRRKAVQYRRFGTTYPFHLQESGCLLGLLDPSKWYR